MLTLPIARGDPRSVEERHNSHSLHFCVGNVFHISSSTKAAFDLGKFPHGSFGKGRNLISSCRIGRGRPRRIDCGDLGRCHIIFNVSRLPSASARCKNDKHAIGLIVTCKVSPAFKRDCVAGSGLSGAIVCRCAGCSKCDVARDRAGRDRECRLVR